MEKFLYAYVRHKNKFRSMEGGAGTKYLHAHFTNKEKKVKVLQVSSACWHSEIWLLVALSV